MISAKRGIAHRKPTRATSPAQPFDYRGVMFAAADDPHIG
jgi:hypothetical protein